MKDKNLTKKPTHRVGLNASAGPKGVAIALPAYGIDMIDSQPIQAVSEEQPNHTGLPDQLKAGLEHLSGMDLSDVRVHSNSSKPHQLQALAYAQGSHIYVAPGQEKHVPHEAWHLVQQKQGRVQPTMQMAGVNINDNAGLEKEADRMGNKAKHLGSP